MMTQQGRQIRAATLGDDLAVPRRVKLVHHDPVVACFFLDLAGDDGGKCLNRLVIVQQGGQQAINRIHVQREHNLCRRIMPLDFNDN